MTTTFRFQPRTLDLLSGLLAVIALLLLVWTVDDTVTPVAPRIATVVPGGGTPAVVETMASAIVARNVFSASRRAPTVRFTPPGSELPPPIVMMGTLPLAGADSTAGADAAARDTPPRLYGIIAQDGVRRALLLLTANGDSPRLYDVGDRQHGYRVVSIAQDRVVLATSTGSRTLRLLSRALQDSLENMP